MQAVVRAYSPIQKHFTIDPEKAHAWMERKDHNEEIRSTLKDLRPRPATAHSATQSSLPMKQKLQKPSVNSFMSPVKSIKSRESSATLRKRHVEAVMDKNATHVIGCDSTAMKESKNPPWPLISKSSQ